MQTGLRYTLETIACGKSASGISMAASGADQRSSMRDGLVLFSQNLTPNEIMQMSAGLSHGQVPVGFDVC